MVKRVILNLDEAEFKKLQNQKEEALINNEATSWEDFILKLADIRE